MKKSMLVAAIGLLLSFGAFGAAQQPDNLFYVQSAQTHAGAPGGNVQYEKRVVIQGAPGMAADFPTISFFMEGKPVKGAPYSADAVTESIQTLADGNRIVHNSTSKIYRDSEGRTRREEAAGVIGGMVQITTTTGGGVMGGVMGGTVTSRPAARPTAPRQPKEQIFISDPVAGVSYVLDPEARTARQFMAPAAAGGGGRPLLSAAQASEQMQRDVETAIASLKGGQGTVTIKDGGSEMTVTRSGTTRDEKTQSLGTQTIEGVEAEGTLSTITIPAGAIGNELPIVMTYERWYSAKLQTIVLSKRHDPRLGDTTFKLTNLSQSNPDASLFQVPPDYTLAPMPQPKREAVQK